MSHVSERPRILSSAIPQAKKTLEFEIIRLKGIGESDDQIKDWIRSINKIISGLFDEQPNVRLSHTPNKFIYSSDAIIVKGSLVGDPADVSVERLVYNFGDKFKNELKSWLELNPVITEANQLFDAKLKASHFLNVRRFSFGCLVEMNKYAMHFEPQFADGTNYVDDDIVACFASFEHDKQHLVLKMIVATMTGEERYQFILNYSSIRGFILSRDEGQWSVFINLIWPPLLYKINKKKVRGIVVAETVGDRDKEQLDNDKVDDEVEFQQTILTERVTRMPQMRSAAEVGRCHILKLAFSMDTEKYRNWNKLTNTLINVQKFAGHDVTISFAGISLAHPRDQVRHDVDDWYKEYVAQTLQDTHLPFGIRYALHCVWTLNFKFIDEIDYHVQIKDADYLRSFCRRLVTLANKDAKATELALVDLFHAIDSGEHIHIVNTFETRYKKHHTGRITYRLIEDNDEKYCYIRRAIHAPSRTLFLPPMLYLKSRFLRSYDPECAIRILIRDDNLSPVSFTVRGHQSAFYKDFIVEKISAGIDIFGRHYDYLGNSTSQLRDFGYFMYAKDKNGKVAKQVREEIGDLNVIKNPAKYVARLGQAFSQPMGVVRDIPKKLVTCIPDVERNGYIFSDGVGKISPQLAIELAKSLGIVNREIPSAYQIRYAGYKGMLILNPLLNGPQIVFRQSMNKFNSNDTSLDVLKAAEPRYAYLNKPFINILNQKGISNAVFLKLQLDAIRSLTDSFLCSCKASLLLKSTCGNLKLPYDGLTHSGIDILAEPFFRGILDSVSRKSIREMKERARIPLPKETCRNLMGVLDDTVNLEYGQVFVQYRHHENGQKKIVTGEVLVTKFPCMHPGDVRKLEAVDIPSLRHLVDCIVFPQKGHRPHPDEMAGSDLDGDEYFVSWDKDLIYAEPNYPPMDYPTVSTKQDVPEVTVRHILEFYSLFIRDHGVGVIANSHLAMSDKIENGINNPICIGMAGKYAVALDYAKTGENAVLANNEKPERYPDFMDKTAEKPTYQSNNALGYLHRNIALFEEVLSGHRFESIGNIGNIDLLEVCGWERYKPEALKAYEEYKHLVGYLQRHFGIEDEMSLVSESYAKQSKYLEGKNEKNDSLDMVSGLVRTIFKKLKTRFDSYVKLHRLSDIESVKLASSWYMVTREKMRNAKKPLLGLPWTISDVLQGLAASRTVSSGHGTKHQCVLDDFERFTKSKGFNQSPTVRSQVQRREIHKLMEYWLESMERKGYFCFSLGGLSDVLPRVKMFVGKIVDIVENGVSRQTRQVTNEEIVYLAFQCMIHEIDNHFKQGIWNVKDDFITTLAITSAMTLFRFYRTRDIRSICDDDPNDLLSNHMITVCIDASSKGIGDYARSADFVRELKSSDISNVVVKVYEQGFNASNNVALVTAVGSRQSLYKFKNALSSDNFYYNALRDDIFN